MKILIADDNLFSRNFICDFIEQMIGFKPLFILPMNYSAALTLIRDHYDIVLLDYNLGEISTKEEDRTGHGLYHMYKSLWPKSLCYLYSAEYHIVNRNPNVKVNCLSDKELQDTLKYHFLHDFATGAEQMTPPANAIAMPYSEKFCDERHLKDKEDRIAIKATQEKYEIKNEADHNAIKDSIDGFKTEIKGHNNKIFWVVVTGVGAQVLTFISIISFIIAIASKIKIAG